MIGCVVQLRGEINFIGNEAQDGGALYIITFGQLIIFPNTTIRFEKKWGKVSFIYYVKLKTHLSVLSVYFPHYIENSAVSTAIKMEFAWNKSCAFWNYKVYFLKPIYIELLWYNFYAVCSIREYQFNVP